MDNRIFNVNGSGRDMLLATLNLVSSQHKFYGGLAKFKGWYFDPKKGLVLTWYKHDKCNAFLSTDGLFPEQAVDMIMEWLVSEEAKSIDLDSINQWITDAEHDGSNSDGWYVYCETWGHIGNDHYAICAVTPAFCWHGK